MKRETDRQTDTDTDTEKERINEIFRKVLLDYELE